MSIGIRCGTVHRGSCGELTLRGRRFTLRAAVSSVMQAVTLVGRGGGCLLSSLGSLSSLLSLSSPRSLPRPLVVLLPRGPSLPEQLWAALGAWYRAGPHAPGGPATAPSGVGASSSTREHDAPGSSDLEAGPGHNTVSRVSREESSAGSRLHQRASSSGVTAPSQFVSIRWNILSTCSSGAAVCTGGAAARPSSS